MPSAPSTPPRLLTPSALGVMPQCYNQHHTPIDTTVADNRPPPRPAHSLPDETTGHDGEVRQEHLRRLKAYKKQNREYERDRKRRAGREDALMLDLAAKTPLPECPQEQIVHRDRVGNQTHALLGLHQVGHLNPAADPGQSMAQADMVTQDASDPDKPRQGNRVDLHNKVIFRQPLQVDVTDVIVQLDDLFHEVSVEGGPQEDGAAAVVTPHHDDAGQVMAHLEDLLNEGDRGNSQEEVRAVFTAQPHEIGVVQATAQRSYHTGRRKLAKAGLLFVLYFAVPCTILLLVIHFNYIEALWPLDVGTDVVTMPTTSAGSAETPTAQSALSAAPQGSSRLAWPATGWLSNASLSALTAPFNSATDLASHAFDGLPSLGDIFQATTFTAGIATGSALVGGLVVVAKAVQYAAGWVF